MKQSLYRGLFACLSLSVLASCQDYDGGFSEEQIKKAAYDKHFEKTFGTPDPNQDWSMATLVKANVNLPGLTGTAKMNICTGDPRLSSTRLLAQIMLKDGKGVIDFDAIKGSDNVFVTVEQDGEYKVFSQYALQNGMLNIGNITPEMLLAAAPMTRAFTASCPTTQGTTTNRKDVEVDYCSDHEVFDCMKIRYPDPGTDERTLEQWIAATKAFVDQENGTGSFPFTDESVRHFVVTTGIDWSNEPTLKSSVDQSSKVGIAYNGNFKTEAEWQTDVDGQYGALIKGWWAYNDCSPWEETGLVANSSDNGFDWEKSTLTLKPSAENKTENYYTYNTQKKTIEEWKSAADVSLNFIFVWKNYDGPWETASFSPNQTDCAAGTDGAIYVGTFPESEWVLKSNAKEVPTYKTVKVKLQYLDNVETSPAPAWDAPLGYSFFGPGAFFEESVAYYSQGKNEADHCQSQKLGKYYTEEEMVEMEKGFCIKTTSTGPIELPYIFGCTDYSNQFGYIYWKDGDELKPDFNPYELKHFVLIEDARPQSNIHKESATGTAIGPKEFNSWNPYLSGQWLDGTQTEQDNYDAAANHSYFGTTYRVMFFGDDYSNATGTYDFPAGYRIAFFITTLSTSNTTASDEEKLFTTHHEHGQGTKFNYSLPEFNEGLNHLNTKRPGGPKGMVKCIVWNHDGNTYMGFGDNSGDEDLNDIVFLVKGNFTPTTNIIKVAPIKWHLNYEGKHHDGTNDTVKDDDLYFQESKNVGGTYSKPNGTPIRSGFTFVGWAATPNGPVLSETDLTNVTVEDENGACYFAIWEPVGETVKIRWHLNYEGEHIEKHNGEDGHDVYATNTVAKSTGTYNKPSTNPTRSGYTFRGWATEPNATEPNAFTGDNPEDQTAERDVCYYALWEELDDPGSDPEPITWILACEDLGGSFDYDFNDVVWSVQTSWNSGTPTTKVKVLAAGGTLGFALKYNGTQICTKGNAFAETTTDDQVVNAGGENGVDRTPVEFTLTTAIENLSSNWRYFSVVVKDHGNSHHEVQNVQSSTLNSKAPQIILLPEQWEWPTELTPINQAYTNFNTWVTDNTAATWGIWSDHKQNGKTVSRQ